MTEPDIPLSVATGHEDAQDSAGSAEQYASAAGARLVKLEGRVFVRFSGEVEADLLRIPYDLVPAQGVLAKPAKWRKMDDEARLALVRERVTPEAKEALRRQVVGRMHAGDSAAAGLPGNPWWSIIEMNALSRRVLSRLSAVQVPCLVVHAREDDVATVENARAIVRGVRRAPVDLVLLDDSYHMVTVDRQRRTVIRRTVAFVRGIAGEPDLQDTAA